MNKVGYDPRSIANAVLDIAEKNEIGITNLALNKILFFLHADFLASDKQKLISISFEAWQYGPVLPIIYHQFKMHGSDFIQSRAFRLDTKTGNQVIAEYHDIGSILPLLEKRFLDYGRLDANALVNLSHAKGSPWHQVWHGLVNSVGMKIHDSLILQYSGARFGTSGFNNATIH